MNASIQTTPRCDAVLDHLVGLGARPRRRLLAEHVLAGIGGPFRPLRVQVVRQRDVDGIDRVVFEQFVVGASTHRVAQSDAVGGLQLGLLEEVRGLRGLARDCGELDAFGPDDRRDHDLARDVRSAENTDAHDAMLQRSAA